MKEDKLVVIFDRDDVINDLNVKIAQLLGYPYEILVCYSIHDNTHLPEEIRNKIIEYYHDPDIFRQLSPVEGYKEIPRIKKDPRVYLVVNSLSLNEEISKVKREWDKKFEIDFFDEYLDEHGYKKTMQSAFIQVEDCLGNLWNSPAEFKILIDKPYNKGKLPPRTIRVKDLREAVEIAEFLVSQY